VKIITRVKDAVTRVKVDIGETLVVSFCPDGANEPVGGGRLESFTIGAAIVPGGGMALTISLPRGKVYRAPENKLVLFLHSLEGYKSLAFEEGMDTGSTVELERYE